MARTYWLDLFTVETWQEFRDHGAGTTGFRESRWKTVQRIRPGDLLLCYLTRASRWVGLLEVTGEPFYDETPIWKSQVFPSRLPVQELIVLDPEFGVPVLEMREELSVFEGLNNPNRWSGPFRGSPARWKSADGEAVTAALEVARENPVDRPLGKIRTSLSPTRSIERDDGETLLIPEEDEPAELFEPADAAEGTTHTEIQYLLMKLGASMGFDLHLDTFRQRNGPAKAGSHLTAYWLSFRPPGYVA